MTWQAGDIGAADGTALVSRLIQFGQYIHGDPFWRWNHIFIVTDSLGNTIEATGRGVTRSNVSEHKNTVNLGCPADRSKVVEFAESQVGIEYGYLNDVLLGMDCLLGWKWSWRGDSLICSELGALALEAGGWTSPIAPSLTMPADLVRELLR